MKRARYAVLVASFSFACACGSIYPVPSDAAPLGVPVRSDGSRSDGSEAVETPGSDRSGTGSGTSDVQPDCTYEGKPLHGRVQIVEHFPDFDVQVVEHFPDLRVQYVEHFPDECGKWQLVEHFPDFKIQLVEHFPDFKIELVEHFPGLP